MLLLARSPEYFGPVLSLRRHVHRSLMDLRAGVERAGIKHTT
jgi:hypothetical protein